MELVRHAGELIPLTKGENHGIICSDCIGRGGSIRCRAVVVNPADRERRGNPGKGQEKKPRGLVQGNFREILPGKIAPQKQFQEQLRLLFFIEQL